jgi:YbbR domain-containing protein
VSFVPRILAKNWQLKLAALAMAILLWTVPRFDAQDSRVLQNVPVRVQLNDPMWTQVGEASPPSVTVSLSGPTRELLAFGVEPPPVLIPMDEVLSGDTTVILSGVWFRGSGRPGVVVEDLTPRAVRLTFEAIEQRPVRFSVPVHGQLPQGRSLAGPPEVTPELGAVFGRLSRVAGMDSIRLMPLDLSTVDTSGTVILSVDSAALAGLDVQPRDVSVFVPTEPTVARELTDMPVVPPRLDTDPQLQTRPVSVSVVLLGAQSLVEAVNPENLRVTIPMSRAGLAPGEEERIVVVVEGVPPLVEYRTTPEWVLLRRPAGQ